MMDARQRNRREGAPVREVTPLRRQLGDEQQEAPDDQGRTHRSMYRTTRAPSALYASLVV